MSTELSYVLTETSTETLDMNNDEIHEEVDLILNCTGPEIMELVATDPAYYIDIISRYTKTKDGREIYLPDLCNIIVTKNESEYRIKFKLTDNSSWYEVGFTGKIGADFTEKDVHEAFVRKVNYALNRPVDSHRAMLIDTLQPGSTRSSDTPVKIEPTVETTKCQRPEPQAVPVRSQGDQTKLSKIDRFMGRTTTTTTTTTTPAPQLQETPREPASAPSVAPSVAPAPAREKEVRFDIPPKTVSSSTSKASLALSELDILRTLCPEERKAVFDNLVNLLRSNDLFYQSLIDLLPRLTSGQRYLVINFLQN